MAHVAIAAGSFVVLVVVAMMLGTIISRLARIEARLAERPPENTAYAPPAPPAEVPCGDFERFLAEDRKRMLMGKKEQAAAYRAWRKENGLTWKAGDDKT